MALRNTGQFLTSEQITELNQQTSIANERTIASLSITLAALALINEIYALLVVLSYPVPFTAVWCVSSTIVTVILSTSALPFIYRWMKTGHPYSRA